jgi:O-antigen/teichoic acid export membrane protein
MTDEVISEAPVPEIPTPAKKGGINGLVDKVKKKFSGKKAVVLEAHNEREELWNTVGYHRITGGFFYSYILLIGGALVALLTVSVILPIFMPYPQITGYQNIVTGTILGVWVGMFDLNMGSGGGLSDGVTRFIGQFADTNPRRALRFMSFYIWWEMWMGLVKVTLFMSLALFFFVHTSFAYLVAFIIPQVLVNYPGMCGIMSSALNSFQRGDKNALLGWLNSTVFSNTIKLVFLVIGKWWGDTHPVYGELMGITIFYCISGLIDNFVPFLIGAPMFAKVLKPRGLRLREMFDPRMDRTVIRQCLSYTGKQWIASQAINIFNYFLNLWIFIQLPSWVFWTGLLSIINVFGNLASMQGGMMNSTVPAFSESFNNGKKELCRYFIHNSLKYYTFITGFFVVSLVVLSSNIIKNLVIAFPGLQYYEMATVLVPSVILTSVISPLQGLPAHIFNACHRPLSPYILNLITTPTGYVFMFLFLYLCVWTNTLPVWVYMMYPGFFNGIIYTIIAFAWIQKSLLKIDYKKIAWQVIISPLLAAACYGFVLWGLSLTLWPWLNNVFTVIIATASHSVNDGNQYGVLVGSLIMLFAVLFAFPGGIYAPFSGLFGAWDEFTLEEFRKCALIAGPSKGITMFIYKSFKTFSRISPWYKKFPMNDYDVVQREAEELVAEGKANAILGKGRRK